MIKRILKNKFRPLYEYIRFELDEIQLESSHFECRFGKNVFTLSKVLLDITQVFFQTVWKRKNQFIFKRIIFFIFLIYFLFIKTKKYIFIKYLILFSFEGWFFDFWWIKSFKYQTLANFFSVFFFLSLFFLLFFLSQEFILILFLWSFFFVMRCVRCSLLLSSSLFSVSFPSHFSSCYYH